MNKFQVRKKIRAIRAEQRSLLNACRDAKTGEVREMTDEESQRFDELEKKVGSLEEMCARLEQVDDEEEATDEDEEAKDESASSRSTRSTRTSDPDQFNGTSPAVHTRRHSYSILRAMRAALAGRSPDGLEGEVTKEVRRFAANKTFRGQFSMPIDPSPELRAIMYPNASRRDLTTSTGTGGIFTVPELPLIDLLRPRLVMARLGCTMLTGMQGLFAIPRQSGKSTVYWVGETNSPTSATNSNQTLDQVPFSPKLAVDVTNISRQFINQTSVSAESFVLNDLAKSLAVEWDRVSINGLGSGSNQPLGILQNTTIQTNSSSLALGTNGGTVSWATVVNMEAKVANFNADSGRLGYLTNPTIRGEMKQIPKGASSTFPIFIWEDGSEPGVGVVNGYPAYATTNVPSNLTKGSASGVCSALLYGNFEDCVIASWDDGVDFLINPYTGQNSASVAISMEMSVDTEVRHPESFSIVTDAL